MAANLLGQLPCFLIADIARRGTDKTRYSVLFHIFAHINGDQRVHGVKQLGCQLLDQLGLAHTRGTDKDKAGGAMPSGQVGAGALDGTRHGVNGFVLTDDVAFQRILQPQQTPVLGFLDFDRGDARPQLDDLRHVVHRDLDLCHAQLQRGQFFALLRQIRLDGCQRLVVDGALLARLLLGVFQLMLAGFQRGDCLLRFRQLGDFGVAQAAAGTGFVQQVDGLVGQETVGDIALRQLDDGGHHRVRHAHAVVLFVVDAHALDDLDGFQNRGFLDLDRLKTAFQRGIFFNILAVLGKRRRADDLHLPAGERGFHNVGGVHRTVRIARADDGMNLVNKQNDVSGGLDLADQPLDALLKLPAELRAGNQRRHIQQVDLLVAQAGRHLPLGNALGDALGDGGLADARFTDQAGVVFLAAAQNLDGAVNFAVAPDDAVGLAVPCLLGQVFAVGFQKFAAGGFIFFAFALGVVLLARAEAEGEHRAAAGDKILLRVVLVGGVLHRAAHQGRKCAGFGSLLQEAAQTLLHIFKVLVGHTELFHQVIDRLDMHFLGAGQAIALLRGLAVLHTLDKNNGRAFFTFDTKHCTSPLCCEWTRRAGRSAKGAEGQITLIHIIEQPRPFCKGRGEKFRNYLRRGLP